MASSSAHSVELRPTQHAQSQQVCHPQCLLGLPTETRLAIYEFLIELCEPRDTTGRMKLDNSPDELDEPLFRYSSIWPDIKGLALSCRQVWTEMEPMIPLQAHLAGSPSRAIELLGHPGQARPAALGNSDRIDEVKIVYKCGCHEYKMNWTTVVQRMQEIGGDTIRYVRIHFLRCPMLGVPKDREATVDLIACERLVRQDHGLFEAVAALGRLDQLYITGISNFAGLYQFDNRLWDMLGRLGFRETFGKLGVWKDKFGFFGTRRGLSDFEKGFVLNGPPPMPCLSSQQSLGQLGP